ncbi:helix-turn-helix domain-containing protein [Olivibacter domesticus]|uniref:AraC-type DNA-binding protein n=1 Tax=Olivibacter domesticus TaxID=407022 RepID=A0A1H7KVM8_OLID1|nr:helix-turn-helix domain-containing protein [Olivibacter domesticus]SEK90125.1 AraC-type DNA-binding protein [Olivibacter domesticus]
MKDTHVPTRIVSIGEINSASGQEFLGDQFHVTRTNEIIGQPSYERPVKGDHFTFLLVLAGTTCLKYNLLDYKLEPNDLFVIAPGIIHEYHTGIDGLIIGTGFTKTFYAESLIHKKDINVFEYLSSNTNPHFQLSAKEAGVLHDLMLMLKTNHANQEHAFQFDLMFHSFNLFMLELAAIIKRHRPDNGATSTRRMDLLNSFLKLLAVHFKVERSVQFYAEKIFITPKHLTKVVKEETGKSVGQLVNEMVIAEAKILLDTSSLTVGNVATELNFSNQFFFSKFFKKHSGLTPSQFRTNTSKTAR